MLRRFPYAPITVGLTVLLVAALTACEGGYSVTGHRVKESHSIDRGEIDVRIKSANGSVCRDIDLDYANATVDVEVTLEVEKGMFELDFLGGEDEVAFSLKAGSGQKQSGTGHMVTDNFGEAAYRVTATEAKGVAYHISYQVRR